MLRYRLVSAFVIITCALIFVGLDARAPNAGCHGLWLLPLAGYLVYGSAMECIWMARRSLGDSVVLPSMICTAGVMLAACIPILWPLSGEPYPADCLLGRLGWTLAASAIALVAGFVWMFPSYQPNSGFFPRAILAGWVSTYFGTCFGFALALRMVGSPAWGLYLLVGLIVVTKFSDSGAYFVGRALGRHKLCPNVSPGKTIEGLLGGILTACLVAAIYFKLCAPWGFGADRVSITWLGVILFGVLVSLAGVCGDLLESVFKREMECKDSGKMIPGLGGLWDVTDSLLPAAVVGYLVMLTGWIEGPL